MCGSGRCERSPTRVCASRLMNFSKCVLGRRGQAACSASLNQLGFAFWISDVCTSVSCKIYLRVDGEGGGGRGQGREGGGSVDQLQDCTLSGDGGGEERKEGRMKRKKERQRWSVVVPEEEAWMMQATGLCKQRAREREREVETLREKKARKRGRESGRGRHAGDRGEREHTHFCNLIRESSRLLPSASKG